MKRAFAALLCVVWLFSLAACSRNPADTTATTTREDVLEYIDETTTDTEHLDVTSTTSTEMQGTTTTLEDVLEYIDKTTTVTEHPDGTTTYTFENVITKPETPTVRPGTTTSRNTSTTTTQTGQTTVVVTEKSTTTTKPAPIPTVSSTTTATTTTTTNTAVPTTTEKVFSYEYTKNQQHTAIPIEQRYYYSLLDSEWKAVYRKIDTAVRNLEPSVSFDFDISQDRKHRIYFLYMLDTPELFFLVRNVSIHSGTTSKIVFSYSVGKNEGENCRYGSSTPEITEELRQKILAKKSTFDSAVKAIVQTIPASAPDVVKERMLYDKILLSSNYNLAAANGQPDAAFGKWDGLANDNWTAYGILANHTGVCESYSKAFQVLCNAVGIPCTFISNYNHAWNAVKINGDWYQCDVTFDDPLGGDPNEAYHTYFNLTDDKLHEMGFSRTWEAGPYVDEGFFINLHYPKCTATAENFENFVAKYGK